MTENPFDRTNSLIEKFMQENELEQYHVTVFLEQKHGVIVVDKEEYEALLDLEENSKSFKDEPMPMQVLKFK